MKEKNLVSVVIPTYNRKKMLLRLVDGLLTCDYKNLEIIIVNDSSTDRTKEVIEEKYAKDKRVKLITNTKNLYTAGSRNKGARLAKGEYLFFVDDDNVVTKSLITNMVTVMDDDSTVGEVGPMMYYYHNKKKLFWAGAKRNMTTSKTNFLIDARFLPKENTWETGDILNAFMVRTSVVKKYNISFIENLGIMYEESDYAYRIREAGFKILAVKNAIIYHDTEESSNEPAAFLKHTLKGRKRVYYTARNRLVFHALYSSLIQRIGIILFWNWLFAFYYSYNILRYSGSENYTLVNKLQFINEYFQGIVAGIKFNFTKKL